MPNLGDCQTFKGVNIAQNSDSRRHQKRQQFDEKNDRFIHTLGMRSSGQKQKKPTSNKNCHHFDFYRNKKAFFLHKNMQVGLVKEVLKRDG